MIAKVFLLIIGIFFMTEIMAERIHTLKDFQKININDTLVYLQEDPIFFSRLFSDFLGNMEPFVKGLMGFNRLKIGGLANETLQSIENIMNGTSSNRRRRKCFEENNKILLLLYQDAVSDWQCMKVHMIKLFDIMVPLWKTLFDFTLINDAECGLNPFCLIGKGFDTAKLSSQMLAHGVSIMGFGADFLLDTRVCQKDIKPFEKISKVVIENFRICALVP